MIAATYEAALIGALAVTLMVGLVYGICYAAHEMKWARRERSIRVGGPASRTLADRLAEHQIEPAPPDEYIATRPIEGKPYYQSDPTVWDNPKKEIT